MCAKDERKTQKLRVSVVFNQIRLNYTPTSISKFFKVYRSLFSRCRHFSTTTDREFTSFFLSHLKMFSTMILMNWNLPEKENPEHPGSDHCGHLSGDLFQYKMAEGLTSFVMTWNFIKFSVTILIETENVKMYSFSVHVINKLSSTNRHMLQTQPLW